MTDRPSPPATIRGMEVCSVYRFTIRDILGWTLVVAIALGYWMWWQERLKVLDRKAEAVKEWANQKASPLP